MSRRTAAVASARADAARLDSPRAPRVTALAMAAVASLSAAGFAVYSRATSPWVALGFVALTPWLVALDRLRTLRGALAAGVVMAVAFELAVFGWFALAITDYTGAPVWAHVAILALLSPLLQPELVTTALARAVVRRDGGGPLAVVLVTAAAFVATEAVVPKLFGDTLGYPLHGAPWLRQGADLAGVPGLTFVIVVVNACVAEAAGAYLDGRRTRRRVLPLAAAAALVGALAGYGAWRCATLATAADDAMTVGLVQANLGHYDRMAAEIGRYDTVRLILDEHVSRSAPALARDDLALLVWPETVYPTTFGRPKSEEGAAFDREISEFVARARVPLIFGTYDVGDDGAEYNAAFFLAPDAGGTHPSATSRPSASPRPFAVYRKTRLFPLTERVPALLESAWLRDALPWLGTWRGGDGARVVSVRLRDGRTVQVAPLICYDVLDPELARAAARDGAEVIVTLSNDSWFAFGAGPQLHMLGAAFRSIETHRPQIRATNTGISAFIDATGTIVASAGVNTHATLVATVVPTHAADTMVMRYGEWINAWSLVLVVGLLVAGRFTRRRPRAVT